MRCLNYDERRLSCCSDQGKKKKKKKLLKLKKKPWEREGGEKKGNPGDETPLLKYSL